MQFQNDTVVTVDMSNHSIRKMAPEGRELKLPYTFSFANTQTHMQYVLYHY